MTVSNGAIELLAGSGTNAYREGTGSGASFTVIGGLKLDGSTLYVVDGDGFFDQLSRVNIVTGQVSLIRNDPQMITINTARGIELYNNNYYILNGGSSQIYRIPFSDTGIGEWVAGTARFGNKNGSGAEAWVGRPWDVAFNRDRTTLYLSENNKLRQIDRATAAVSSLVGSDIDHYVEGTRTAARFSNVMGIALNSTGDALYVVDRNNHRIRKVDLASQTTSLVSGAGLTNFGVTGTNGYQEGARCETEQTVLWLRVFPAADRACNHLGRRFLCRVPPASGACRFPTAKQRSLPVRVQRDLRMAREARRRLRVRSGSRSTRPNKIFSLRIGIITRFARFD